MSDERNTLPKHIFRRVEAELYRYPRYKQAIATYPGDRGDVLSHYRDWPPPEGQISGVASDRTGGGAIRLQFLDERRQKAAVMVAVIESVFVTLSDEEQALVRLKYFERDHYTNEQIIATMQVDYGTSRTQWYRMRADIVRQFAEEMGWLPNGRPERSAS